MALSHADSRRSMKGRSAVVVVLTPVAVLIALIVAVVMLSGEPDRGPQLDADLCPMDTVEIRGSATFLFDFRKPLFVDRPSRAGDLLHRVALALPGHVEMQVFTLAASGASPRTLVGRLCKPYDNVEIRVETAKDQRAGARDCDDLPAQIPDGVRASATRFCLLRDGLRTRVDALARQSMSRTAEVDSAYLVEALEDSWIDFESRRPPHVLYVFSDMMQHAHWYSHLDVPWTDWNYREFRTALGLQTWSFDRQPDGAGMRVEVFYLPRNGRTDQPRPKRVHQQFWREYFADAEVVFHEQPSVPDYAAKRLMNVPSEAEQVAQEREEAERLLRQVREEQAALEREQQELQRRAEAERLAAAGVAEDRQTTPPVTETEGEATPALDTEAEFPAASPPDTEAESGAAPTVIAEAESEAAPTVIAEAESEAAPTVIAETESDAAPTVIAETESEAAPGPVTEAESEPAPTLPGEDEAPAAAEVAAPTGADPPPETAPSSDAATNVSDAGEPESVGDVPEGGVDVEDVEPTPDEPSLPACAVRLAPGVNEEAPYPSGGQFDFGSAVIVVRYVVDEAGTTPDDLVEVVQERSQLDRQSMFPRFARSARQTVQGWRFTFDDPDDTSCTREQTRLIGFQFIYREI